MPFSEALNVSYNIPAYWTYQTILNKGKSVEPYMTKMGYDVADYSVESLPLGGGIDPTVVQHTNGYQTLANGGKYEPWYIVDSIKDDTGNVIYQHQSTGELKFIQKQHLPLWNICFKMLLNLKNK